MKILIVDDEKLARDRLQDLLLEMDSTYELLHASNGKDALDVVNNSSPDIILLDIRMPVMDGLETAQHLTRLENPPAVVFTTAYQDHALQAFDSNAVDYLLKPIRPERLKQGIDKAQRISRARVGRIQEQITTPSQRQHLSVTSQGRIELIPVEDILCFHAEQKYVSIHLRDREILTDESLKKLESEFQDRFLRIHRNALVATNKIESVNQDNEGNNIMKLRGLGKPLIISRRHLKSVKEKLREFNL